jgi:acetyltransferase-like isoleucine patch superfamily enzyme
MSKGSPVQIVGLGVSYFRTFIGSLWRMEAQFRGAQFSGKARFEGRPIITLTRGSRMNFGAGVSLNSATRANPLGCFQPCVLRTLSSDAELILGDNVGLSGAVVCAGRSIRIGRGTIAGSGAMIIDNDFHALEGDQWRDEYVLNARPVEIGEFVFIGSRAIILKGVRIGDRARIGAGAVVSRDVPAGCLAAGNPAEIFQPRATASP